jgi:hypothetical protein
LAATSESGHRLDRQIDNREIAVGFNPQARVAHWRFERHRFVRDRGGLRRRRSQGHVHRRLVLPFRVEQVSPTIGIRDLRIGSMTKQFTSLLVLKFPAVVVATVMGVRVGYIAQHG